ncbi:MAG: L-serine ammonia-lyase, iron-sulfur-dependent subunit beta [Dialister sp.]|nr:L-serine ammonia-lyase, iron-sulfur-dependent subunit beta [Dialister sp.]MDY6084489.1 L-serine ammonia-lyase, iron-sulfur-dependent subunit beta [Dialister sp.]
MGIFDIIGPVMIGPSSSHTAGAARIGGIAKRVLGEDVASAVITLYGSFAKTGHGHGTDRALVAGLLGYAPDDGSIRNAIHIARARGVSIQFKISKEDAGHPNVARMEVTGKSGRHTVVVGRSLGGGRVMITSVDGHPMEITGEDHCLITRHRDVPGVVADVGRVLAKHDVNISTMRLFRKGKGTEATMVIHTDSPVPASLKQELEQCNPNISHILTVEALS